VRKLTVKLGFIILCLLIATLYSVTGAQFVAWFAVVFFSVLFHEFGHAIMASSFGKRSLIELSFMGGTTYFSQEGLKKWQLFLISLNGPLFGLGLFFAASYLKIGLDPGSIWSYACKITAFINLFWTIFNLLPILPLDGGQLLRIVFEVIFKNKGLFFAGILSSAFSTALGLVSFLLGQYFIGSILFLFAFQNFELIKQARYISSADREDQNRQKLQEGLMLFETQQFDKAKQLFEDLRTKTKNGVIYNQSTTLLALMLRLKQNYEELYNFLKDLPKLYENDLSALMHEAAFFHNDMEMVKKLSAEAFQRENTKEVAFHSAIASAFFHDDEAAIGWLKTAQDLGLNEEEIKVHPLLKDYIDRL